MIRVEKSKARCPDPLVKEGEKEKIKVLAFYKRIIEAEEKAKLAGTVAAKNNEKDKSYPFKAYKVAALKEVLEQLFHRKCAYCESRYAATQPVDIEHWRPKGRVVTEDKDKHHRGYYWLAADWDNLLPSCIDCNRIREHKDGSTGEKTTLGKGNWFPLENESKRVQSPDEDITLEKPLLLNPHLDEPGEYLEFMEIGVIKPKSATKKKAKGKAETSIRYYALNRTELVQERKARILIIKQKMHVIKSLADYLDKNPAPSEATYFLEDLLSHEMELLYKFQSPEEPYSLMAKQMIEMFIKKFFS